MLQFTRDFVDDCAEMVFTYSSDSSCVARVADWLEQDVVHHGSVLQHWNLNNTNLTKSVQGSASVVFAVPSVPSSITGQPLSSKIHIYVCQVNGVKLADILFSLLCVCPSVSTHI